MQNEPLILTLGLDAQSEDFFNAQRNLYFPVERNFLAAHLTLFHQLPNSIDTINFISNFRFPSFDMEISKLIKLGGGVAYSVNSKELQQLHNDLKIQFKAILIPQDLQTFRPHITIQNKVSPPEANLLFHKLQENFVPFFVKSINLHLWTYLGGPWRHEQTISLI
ncbi:2'-5' RNA ligase family protein [Pedobacter frigidisoli]|nr:2'-5' RNA ligase family protein [Pedobacter frigidisoli]